MKVALQLEEIAMLGLGIYAFSILPYSWWLFLALFLAPDVGMIGYLFNPKIGALLYNIFHHKGLAISLYLIGIYFQLEILKLIGIIVFSHATFDRIFGYRLKYATGFKLTHLGAIGKEK